jgi:hypothetical protein
MYSDMPVESNWIVCVWQHLFQIEKVLIEKLITSFQRDA